MFLAPRRRHERSVSTRCTCSGQTRSTDYCHQPLRRGDWHRPCRSALPANQRHLPYPVIHSRHSQNRSGNRAGDPKCIAPSRCGGAGPPDLSECGSSCRVRPGSCTMPGIPCDLRPRRHTGDRSQMVSGCRLHIIWESRRRARGPRAVSSYLLSPLPAGRRSRYLPCRPADSPAYRSLSL